MEVILILNRFIDTNKAGSSATKDTLKAQKGNANLYRDTIL